MTDTPQALADELERVMRDQKTHEDWTHDKAVSTFIHENGEAILTALRANAEPVAWRYWRNGQNGTPRPYYSAHKPNDPNCYGLTPLYAGRPPEVGEGLKEQVRPFGENLSAITVAKEALEGEGSEAAALAQAYIDTLAEFRPWQDVESCSKRDELLKAVTKARSELAAALPPLMPDAQPTQPSGDVVAAAEALKSYFREVWNIQLEEHGWEEAAEAVVEALATTKHNPAPDAIREALEPVLHWYQSDEHGDRELIAIIRDIVADLQCDRAECLAQAKALRAADALSVAAQTTGGVAGRDNGLVAAIDAYAEAKAAVAKLGER